MRKWFGVRYDFVVYLREKYPSDFSQSEWELDDDDLRTLQRVLEFFDEEGVWND